MAVIDTVADGRVRIRVRPWRGDRTTAEIAAVPAGVPVPRPLIAQAVERARSRGFASMVTPALPRFEWRPFLDEGFAVREHLHLLRHDLLDLPARMPTRTRRVGRRDHDRVLAIDHAAFDSFWQLDEPALREALDATPSVRFRMSWDATAYVLVGRARDRGYLQRLAVRPEAEGQGLGAALVLDALWWLRRWRVRDALVNTQESNTRAVALYERLGFRRRPDGLAVLYRPLGPTTR